MVCNAPMLQLALFFHFIPKDFAQSLDNLLRLRPASLTENLTNIACQLHNIDHVTVCPSSWSEWERSGGDSFVFLLPTPKSQNRGTFNKGYISFAPISSVLFR